MMHVSPSILGADFGNLRDNVMRTEASGADYLHLDVMDGLFVPSISFGMPVIEQLRAASKQVFDVHMMVQAPERYIKTIADCGADSITVHQEATIHLDRTLYDIHSCGKKAGIALNPATPVDVLDCVLDQVDMVLIMTVNPGFGGQKLIPYTLDKIRALRQKLESRGLAGRVDIEVDGGVTCANLPHILEAGANVIVAGSAIFHGDIEENTKNFLKILRAHEQECEI